MEDVVISYLNSFSLNLNTVNGITHRTCRRLQLGGLPMGVLLVVAPAIVLAVAVAVAVVPITIATLVLIIIIAPAPPYAIAIIAKLTTEKSDTRVGGGGGDKCDDDESAYPHPASVVGGVVLFLIAKYLVAQRAYSLVLLPSCRISSSVGKIDVVVEIMRSIVCTMPP